VFASDSRKLRTWLETLDGDRVRAEDVPERIRENLLQQGLVQQEGAYLSLTFQGQIECHKSRFGQMPKSGIVFFEKKNSDNSWFNRLVSWIWGVDTR